MSVNSWPFNSSLRRNMSGKFFWLLSTFLNLCLSLKCSERVEVLLHDDEILRLSCDGNSTRAWLLRGKTDRIVSNESNLTFSLKSTSCGNYYCKNLSDNILKDVLVLPNGKLKRILIS